MTPPEYNNAHWHAQRTKLLRSHSSRRRAFARRDVVIKPNAEGRIVHWRDQRGKCVLILWIWNLSNQNSFRHCTTFVEWIRQQLLKKLKRMAMTFTATACVYTHRSTAGCSGTPSRLSKNIWRLPQKFDASWNWKEHPDIMMMSSAKLFGKMNRIVKSAQCWYAGQHSQRTSQQSYFLSIRAESRTDDRSRFCVIDPHNGRIKAMIGGRNYRTFKYGLNHVTQIHRQPGSAFKPFVYTVALDNGYPACYEVLNQPSLYQCLMELAGRRKILRETSAVGLHCAKH